MPQDQNSLQHENNADRPPLSISAHFELDARLVVMVLKFFFALIAWGVTVLLGNLTIDAVLIAFLIGDSFFRSVNKLPTD